MSSVRKSLLAGVACLGLASAARAADATPEEALSLTQTLQKYIGRSTNADHPLLKITPSGDHYDVAVDYADLLASARAFGLEATLSPSPLHFTMTKLPDGKWRVDHKSDLTLDYKAKDQSGSVKMDGMSSSTIVDANLEAPVSGTTDIATISAKSVATGPKGGGAEVTSVAHAAHMDIKGEAAGPGQINLALNQSLKDRAQHFDLQLPDGVSHAFDLSVGDSAGKASFAAYRNKAVLDLWAWFVAHPSREEMRKDPATFKELLRGLGPLFDRVDADGAVKDVAVKADMGWKVAIANVSGGIGLNGAGATGDFHPHFALSGLVVPTEVMPPWSASLAPKDIAFDVDVTGYDLSRVTDAAIAAIDLDKDPMIAPSASADFINRLLPTGFATANIKAISISGAGYALNVAGQIRGGAGAMPTGSLTVTLKGFDTLRAAMTEGAKTDRFAAQAMAGLGVARAMAKDGPDGTLTWEIATANDGGLTVNGAPLGGGRPAARPRNNK